jgi:hypothetical protein
LGCGTFGVFTAIGPKPTNEDTAAATRFTTSVAAVVATFSTGCSPIATGFCTRVVAVEPEASNGSSAMEGVDSQGRCAIGKLTDKAGRLAVV